MRRENIYCHDLRKVARDVGEMKKMQKFSVSLQYNMATSTW